jgi:hypothetical protein
MATQYQFLANQTLLDDFELICYSPSDEHSNAKERCNFIRIKEEQLFNNCFGWEFYLNLMQSKIVYGTADNPFVYFRENTNYAIGDIVMHNFKLYEVTQATDGTQKPPLSTHYKSAPKFDNADYNYIWHRYLAQIIAFSVMYSTVMYRLIRDTAKGVVKNYEEGSSRAATTQEVSRLKKEAMIDVETIIENMERHIGRNKEAFPDYQNIDSCEAACKPRLRHYGFNVNV